MFGGEVDFNPGSRADSADQNAETKYTKDQSLKTDEMTPKEIAAHYDAKVFESPEAAKVAGFVLGETATPRNVWNKA
ncbi:MAG: hypothetical protein M3447_13530, partial [Acidobacteriota bacterium]|nr:hypothetical protein [Acidobacteriota bacterium]